MTNLLVRDPFFATPFRLMEQFLGGDGTQSAVTGYTPAVDVREQPDEDVLMVDLPGVKAGDVSLEVVDQVLTISGARAPFETGEAQLLERPWGSFVRSLTLPKGVDSDAIAAEYADGVLTLHIPKPAHQKPRK